MATSYNGQQSDYWLKLKELPNQPYDIESSFPRAFDEVTALEQRFHLGLENSTGPIRRDDVDIVHNIRNDAQHKGIPPNQNAIKQRLGAIETVLNLLLNDAFGLSLGTLFLAKLIKNPKVAAQFESAEKYFDKGNYEHCINAAARGLRESKIIQYEKSRGFMSPSLSRSVPEEITSAIRRLSEGLDDVYRTYDLLVAEIDLERQRKCKDIILMNSTERVTLWSNYPDQEPYIPSKEDAFFVLRFVFDVAMSLRV